MTSNDNRDIVIRDDVFEFIYQMALSDATRRVPKEYNCKKLFEDNESAVISLLKSYTQLTVNGHNPSFNTVVSKIKNIDNSIRFGQIQKLINMTMKYFYIKYYDDSKRISNFDLCHAPMDDVMRDFVYRSYVCLKINNGKRPHFRINCAWSKISNSPDSDYDGFQEAVRQIIDYAREKDFLIENRIDFDYRFWKKATRLRDQNAHRQIEITQEIWQELGVFLNTSAN